MTPEEAVREVLEVADTLRRQHGLPSLADRLESCAHAIAGTEPRNEPSEDAEDAPEFEQ